jgi:hypothetical protein
VEAVDIGRENGAGEGREGGEERWRLLISSYAQQRL